MQQGAHNAIVSNFKILLPFACATPAGIRLTVDHRLSSAPLARVTAVLPATVWLLAVATVSISGTENRSTLDNHNGIVSITLRPRERTYSLGTNEDQRRRKKIVRY